MGLHVLFVFNVQKWNMTPGVLIAKRDKRLSKLITIPTTYLRQKAKSKDGNLLNLGGSIVSGVTPSWTKNQCLTTTFAS